MKSFKYVINKKDGLPDDVEHSSEYIASFVLQHYKDKLKVLDKNKDKEEYKEALRIIKGLKKGNVK
jgi:hypothetical protein